MQRKTTNNVSAIMAALAIAGLTACGTPNDLSSDSVVISSSGTTPHTKYNQLGYQPSSTKIFITPRINTSPFVVKDNAGNTVLKGISSKSKAWAYSGEEVSQIDLSSITTEGAYTLEIEGVDKPTSFTVAQDVLIDAHDAAIKAYYFNRASMALTSEFAGEFARPAGHLDTQIKIHASAASAQRPEGTIVSSPKGWYDAGDYNKYIVNSGISTYTLMLAYEHFEDFYKARSLNIPESTNDIPDLLDEILWNVEWMSTMQDPNDGGVYHKLTTLNFSGIINPVEGTEQRYMVQKGTSAALNFAAVMAMASRVYQPFAPAKAAQYKTQALAAYQWAQDNPDVPYLQPADVQTGQYEDVVFEDEFAWAAAELYLASGDSEYLDSFLKIDVEPETPSWQNSSALGYISLLTNGKDILTDDQFSQVKDKFMQLADTIYEQHQASAYATAMVGKDFVWGSNGVASNKAMVLFQAANLSQDDKYQRAGEGLIDYTLGKNPVGISYVTGYGKQTPLEPHHRPTVADDVEAPVPGFLIGGPHSGQQDKCDYPSTLPAISYLDDWCSYSTNEVTINWNAPFVYGLAHMYNKQ